MRAIADTIDRVILIIGRVTQILLIALMAVITFDVVSRRFFNLGSVMLQEIEWHLHTAMFCVFIAYTAIYDGHVRIPIFVEGLSQRTRDLIEIILIVVLLLPFCGVMIYFSLDYTFTSFAMTERSLAAGGLPYRFAIKAFLPLCFILLAVAGISAAIRRGLRLASPALDQRV